MKNEISAVNDRLRARRFMTSITGHEKTIKRHSFQVIEFTSSNPNYATIKYGFAFFKSETMFPRDLTEAIQILLATFVRKYCKQMLLVSYTHMMQSGLGVRLTQWTKPDTCVHTILRLCWYPDVFGRIQFKRTHLRTWPYCVHSIYVTLFDGAD